MVFDDILPWWDECYTPSFDEMPSLTQDIPDMSHMDAEAIAMPQIASEDNQNP